MLTVHPQYIKDAEGNASMVVLPVVEFEKLMEELEELEDVKLYDAAKKDDAGDRIDMMEAFKQIEANRKS